MPPAVPAASNHSAAPSMREVKRAGGLVERLRFIDIAPSIVLPFLNSSVFRRAAGPFAAAGFSHGNAGRRLVSIGPGATGTSACTRVRISRSRRPAAMETHGSAGVSNLLRLR